MELGVKKLDVLVFTLVRVVRFYDFLAKRITTAHLVGRPREPTNDDRQDAYRDHGRCWSRLS